MIYLLFMKTRVSCGMHGMGCSRGHRDYEIRFLGILAVEGKRRVMGVWRQEGKRASFSESREEEGRVHEGR